MPLTVAVQMDPIERIRIAGDSTFALLLEAQARGHRLLHYTPDRLRLQRRAASRPMAEPLTVKDVEGDHARLGEAQLVDLSTVDVVLLRQDPPFDLAYITTTHLLERIHPTTLVVNDPRGVRDAPEKLFVMDFPELMPPTLIARDRAAIEAFRAEHGEVVMKPLYGFGGAAVFKVGVQDPNFGSLFDLFTHDLREPWVIQKFLPAVAKGDKRIILVDGEAKGAVNRVPAGDDIRSNMVRGGAAKETELTDARARDLRDDRPGAEAARPSLRRHRRDRRLSDRDQRHLADRHPRDQAARRPRSRRGDLGRDRGQGQQAIAVLVTAAGLAVAGPRGIYAQCQSPRRPRSNAAPARPRAAPPAARASTARSFSTSSPLCMSGMPATPRRSAAPRSQTLQAALAAGRDEARKALEDGRNGPGLRRGAERRDRRPLARRARNVRPLALTGCSRRQALPTIVAVGGYGRGMLAPGSDIDLLFLLPDKPTPGVEKIVEALLYVLWDLKQKVGHATRTVDECLKQARADMTIRTTLIEARLVIGDKELFETLQTRFDKEIVAKTAPEFVAAKLAEREERVRRAGASRYLVEPNVKEGKGGLRDLNTLFWISKYVYRVADAHELVAAGLFSPREFALFRRCEEFLWTVRCRLHFLAGRAEERLSFDVQRPIARQLGYSTRAGPDRRRTVHEALFPGRQGRRRPDRDRLRRARGAPDQADAGVRPLRRASAPARRARSPTPRTSRSTTTASTSSATTPSSAIRST